MSKNTSNKTNLGIIKFVKTNKIGFLIGGFLGTIMPLVILVLFLLGLHKGDYTSFSFLDYILAPGYILSIKFIPAIPIRIGLGINIILGALFNFLYLGFIGAYIQKILKSKSYKVNVR